MNYWLPGRSYSALGRYEDAADAFQRAAQIKPDDFTANDWRGTTLVRLGRFEEAAVSLEKAYEINSADRSLRHELFMCDLVSSRYENAYRLYPMVFVFGGGAFLLGYLFGFAVLLRFSLKISDAAAPGFRFSLAWLVLFFEGQVGFIFCLGLLSLFRLSESFLLGITLAGLPIIAAATYSFPRQPWGRPFAAPLRLGTPIIMGLSLLGLVATRVFSSWCMEWISRATHRSVEVQNILPYIQHALAGDPFTAVLSVVVVGPMAEEIIFRGLMYGAFERRIGAGWTILVSSALFAFVHLQPMYFIPIFCLGIVLGWARWKGWLAWAADTSSRFEQRQRAAVAEIPRQGRLATTRLPRAKRDFRVARPSSSGRGCDRLGGCKGRSFPSRWWTRCARRGRWWC